MPLLNANNLDSIHGKILFTFFLQEARCIQLYYTYFDKPFHQRASHRFWRPAADRPRRKISTSSNNVLSDSDTSARHPAADHQHRASYDNNRNFLFHRKCFPLGENIITVLGRWDLSRGDEGRGAGWRPTGAVWPKRKDTRIKAKHKATHKMKIYS